MHSSIQTENIELANFSKYGLFYVQILSYIELFE